LRRRSGSGSAAESATASRSVFRRRDRVHFGLYGRRVRTEPRGERAGFDIRAVRPRRIVVQLARQPVEIGQRG
jgi:hypothetical protein